MKKGNSIMKKSDILFRGIATFISITILVFISFIISHRFTVGPITGAMFSLPTNTENYKISAQTIRSSLKDFTIQGNAIKSISNDPWILLQNIDKTYRYIYLDIGDLSEKSTTSQLFFFKNGDISHKQTFTLHEGINIIPLELQDISTLRLDLTNRAGVYLEVDAIKFTNNYFSVLSSSFWIIFLSLSICSAILFILFINNRKSKKSITINQKNYAWLSDIRNSFVLHKTELITSAILELIIFGYEIFNFTLSVDEEREIVHAYGSSTEIENLLLQEGRWGAFLFRKLETLDGTFTPYIETFLSVVFIFAAAVFLLFSFEKLANTKFNKISYVVFIGLFSSLPFIVAEWMCYSIMNTFLSAGMFFVAFTQYLLSVFITNMNNSGKKIILKHKALLISVILINTWNFGMVESIIPFFITATCFALTIYAVYNSNINFKNLFTCILSYVIPFVISFVLYYAIRMIIQPSAYTDKFIHWGNSDFNDIIRNWATMLTNIFNSELPGSSGLLITLSIFIITIIISAFKADNIKQAFISIFCAFCSIAGVFSLNILTGGSTPLRTMISLMLLASVPWIITLEYFKNIKPAHVISIIISISVLWQQTAWLNRIWFGANLCYTLDVNMGYEIGNEIKNEAQNYYEKPIVIVGRYQHNSPNIIKIDAVGQSIFYRPRSAYKTYLLRYLGFDFSLADSSEEELAKEYSTNMPIYPQEGYVQEFNEVIVVRIS